MIEGVLEHNRLDLVSLAAVTAHALQLAEDGPQWCREPSEQLGLGTFYERQGDVDLALSAYALAGSADDRDLRGRALERHALLLRRHRRHDEAVAAWQRLLDGARRPLGARLNAAPPKRSRFTTSTAREIWMRRSGMRK